ncbi:hypothetical protein BD311DRAFT_459149 [Dichomitus squalens]|uniref:Uncharacterized protein n=1 Tax=Dichomitus squalens TaxID=114155 RepID=A0A4Q9MH25_9APHY|nr:hypothetical protein BD311DRAFT_459149 [Dichomitus squalens]
MVQFTEQAGMTRCVCHAYTEHSFLETLGCSIPTDLLIHVPYHSTATKNQPKRCLRDPPCSLSTVSCSSHSNLQISRSRLSSIEPHSATPVLCSLISNAAPSSGGLALWSTRRRRMGDAGPHGVPPIAFFSLRPNQIVKGGRIMCEFMFLIKVSSSSGVNASGLTDCCVFCFRGGE